MATHTRHLKMNATPRAKRVIESAHDEAARLGTDYLGVEHLTLALAAEEHGVVADALAALGISGEALRNEIMQQLAKHGVVPIAVAKSTPYILPGHEPKKKPPIESEPASDEQA
jgi:ATP-dependent Clp protease ATP-binding subunit ClpA